MPGQGNGVHAAEQKVEHDGAVIATAWPVASRIVMCAPVSHPVAWSQNE